MDSNKTALTRRQLLGVFGTVVGATARPLWAGPDGIAPQPYFATVNRALAALEKLGAPVSVNEARQIALFSRQNDSAAVAAAERLLDRYTLARIDIQKEGYASATPGGAQRTLIEQGWRLFLVRVSNSVGVTDKLNVFGGVWMGLPKTLSPGASREAVPETLNVAPYVEQSWLTTQLDDAPPMGQALSGFAVEYRVIQLYSRDRGRRSQDFYFVTANYPLATLAARWRYRRSLRLDFDCLPSRDVVLRVRDADGLGCMASLIIKDQYGRIYPLQAMRFAPDMRFQPQIYRADGETVRLPDGEYTIEAKRGPEYLSVTQKAAISEERSHLQIQLERWIDPAKWGWYSGDTHIHPAGCSHYLQQSEGVTPETIIRHVRGEGLSIGEVLIWGGGYYYQKQFFTGRAGSPPATIEHPEFRHASWQSRTTPKDAESLLRYDMEVSGFPSSHCGHLVLLRLKEQDYPGTKAIQDWPSWNLPVLRWAQEQGAIVGYAHCGQGMSVTSDDRLPNTAIPPFDGPGAHEAIVDVTHGLVDFLSGCDGNPVAELNVWYHILNCGFRVSFVGETDYPCITDERPGAGRSYVRLSQRPVDDAGYDAWVKGLKQGRLYCGDGRSHFLDFRVNDRRSGGDDVILSAPETLSIEVLVAARLEPEPLADISHRLDSLMNGWHIENARINTTREVAVELVVNGLPVEKAIVVADGTPRSIKFKRSITRSSWLALRILPSAHTHPIFVQVGKKPIRASKRSAQWCRACVDQLWEVNSKFMRESERPAAAEAFEHARKVYGEIANECEVD